MKIDIVTIFPEMCLGPLSESIIGRARENGQVEIVAHDLRDWTTDRHRQVDDEPYGGGPGMVMEPEPFFAAVNDLKKDSADARVLLMTPQGQPFTQAHARRLSKESHLIVLCGHYEGIDQRVIDGLVDEEISIGDYVLTNGVLAANVVIDAIVRLLPGVLGDDQSAEVESFSDANLLEAPHYTRPAEFEGRKVPDILLSGHHGKIEQWRLQQALERTRHNRPDLLED